MAAGYMENSNYKGIRGKYENIRAANIKIKRKKRFMICVIFAIIILISEGVIPSAGNITKKVYESVIYMSTDSVKGISGNNKIKGAGGNDISAERHIEVKGKTDSDVSRYLALVNKKNRIGKDFVPDNLKVPDVKFLYNTAKQVKMMEATAAGALEDMFRAAKEDGVNLLAVSGYRTYSYQEWLYKRKVEKTGIEEADRCVAPPGGSEHQTGLAMDIVSDEFMYVIESFCKTKAYKWFEGNAFKYGFIIRYPKGKEDVTTYSFEPWHLRFVGREAATEMQEEGLVLEEYLEKKKK